MCQGEINQVRRRFQLDLTLAEYLSFIDNKTATLKLDGIGDAY